MSIIVVKPVYSIGVVINGSLWMFISTDPFDLPTTISPKRPWSQIRKRYGKRIAVPHFRPTCINVGAGQGHINSGMAMEDRCRLWLMTASVKINRVPLRLLLFFFSSCQSYNNCHSTEPGGKCEPHIYGPPTLNCFFR